MRPLGSPEQLEQRRRQAIALLDEGHSTKVVARTLRVHWRNVQRWRAAYRKDGISGIVAQPAPGRPARLSSTDKDRLEKYLLGGAQAAGFPTDLWTCARITQMIRMRFGVQYHADHVNRLLHAMGWSAQKPERRAIERDEENIAQWVKVEWPRIKKKPAA